MYKQIEGFTFTGMDRDQLELFPVYSQQLDQLSGFFDYFLSLMISTLISAVSLLAAN